MRLGSSKNVFLKPGLTENTEVLYISEWCLFPETWGFFFSDIYCENLVELLEAKPWKAWQLPVSGSHWSFVATQIFFFFFWWELRLVCTKPPAICQLSFKFSHSSTGSWGGFECSSKVRLPVFVCLSYLGGSDSSVSLSVLWIQESRKVVDFSVSSVFYLLLGQHGNFLATYMWRWTPFHDLHNLC